MERLSSEQIRLLEVLRELRDSGILTVDEFEFQVAKVLGRPQVVEPIPFVEEPLAPQEPDETVVPENPDEAQQVEQSDVALVPDTSYESELLEYELVEPDISDEDEILVEENQVAEPPSTSYTSALPIVETETQQNNSSRRKALIGTTAGLVLIAVIGFVALVGGGKSDSTSTPIIDNTTTVTQSTMAANTDAPTTSSQIVATTTTVPQNASTGTVRQPRITTSLVANPDSLEFVVTDLQVTKSQPVGQKLSIKFTAETQNDETLRDVNSFRLLINDRVWDPNNEKSFTQVQSGIWTVDLIPELGFQGIRTGLNKVCAYLKGLLGCAGPTVSFELFEREISPPTISDITISPAIVSAGDTVRVTARIVDVNGIELVSGSLGGISPSLTAGDLSDGIWSYEREITIERGLVELCITAMDINSYGATLCKSITVLEPVLNGLETARNL